MIDKLELLSNIEELKQLVNEEYLMNGKIIFLVWPLKEKINVMDLDVDSLLEMLENRIRIILHLVAVGDIADDVKLWIENIMETSVFNFELYAKRIVSLEKIVSKYSNMYEDVLKRLYTNIALQIVKRYIYMVKRKDNLFVVSKGVNLEYGK